MKNSIKIYEDPEKILEISDDDAEILACKQLLNPLNNDFTIFIKDNFEEKFFKHDVRKDLFKIGHAFWEKYEKIPSNTQIMSILNNEKFCDKKSDYLKEYNKIISFKEEDYVDAYVKDILLKFTKMRKVYFTMLEQFEEIEERGDIGDCLSRFEKIVQLDMSSDLGVEYFSNFDKHCNDLLSIEARQKFGFDELDKTTYGGMPASDTCLFVIMAQPGLGKSQLMMNIAYNWIMAGKNVAMISLEMSEDMYSRRMDGLFADLNVNKLRENIGLLKLKIKQIKSNIPNTQLRIKEFPTGTCTTAMLKQYLKKLKANGFEPDLICVDYLNIMRPNGGNGNIGLYEKGARIAEELRALSSELKKPILTAIQSNRCLLKSSIVEEKTKGKIHISDVEIGDKLLSNNGYNTVVKKYEIEQKRTYKIKTKSGKEIVCTDIHEWPTKLGLKSLSTGLSVGDKLIKQRNILNFKNVIKYFF